MSRKETINKGFKGLHRDNSFAEQPQDTYRFALNAVSESREGDQNHVTNEEGNEFTFNLGIGYTPLGSISVGNSETVIFSVNADETLSRITLVTEDNVDTVLVEADLGFKIHNKIEATFKVRKGCERIIYFVTPTPMYFNIDREEKFQDGNGDFVASKFSLFRRYEYIPIFQSFLVEDGGVLDAGSYNFAIQYLDEDFNPTEWITTSETINIYHDSSSKAWHDKRGSTSKTNFYQDFGGPTNKRIDINLTALDTSYIYFRLAVIEATEGTGLISSVKLSDPISTVTEVISYSGDNFNTVGTVEEIQAFELILEEVEHISQIENRLLLGNVKGSNTNLCRLQHFASKIKSNVSTRNHIINADTRDNLKSGTLNTDHVGYMPGEIYSFGIVYIFEDNSTSPVYHIPGKNSTDVVSEMSTNNVLENTLYLDNSNCGDVDYWGVDSEGDSLQGENVRHHRFPSRAEAGIPHIENSLGSIYGEIYWEVVATGNIDSSYIEQKIEVTFTYRNYGSWYENTYTIDTANYKDSFTEEIYVGSQSSINSQRIYENGEQMSSGVPSPTTGIVYTRTLKARDNKPGGDHYQTKIMGINFSNVEKPPKEVTGNKEVVGYFIVRNEATEDNRTILDTGALLPMLENDAKDYVSAGILNYTPGATFGDIRKKDMYALVHPEHQFLGKEYKNVTEYEFGIQYTGGGASTQYLRSFLTQDVAAGTSYNKDVHKKDSGDGDGFTLHILSEQLNDSIGSVAPTGLTSWTQEDDINEILYLDSLADKTVEDSNNVNKKVYNLSSDNKLGVVVLNKEFITTASEFPYVTLKRSLSDPYASFRTSPYYKETKGYNRFVNIDDGATVYNGDCYFSPMKFNSTVFNDIRLADRAEKSGVWNIIVGVVAIIVGVVVTIVTYGGAAALGAMAVGFGISQISTGIKKEKIAEVYQKLYEEGLQDTVIDLNAETAFGIPSPPSGYSNEDDEIQWRGAYKTFYFESRVPIGLRKGATLGSTDFLNTDVTRTVDEQTSTYRQNLRVAGVPGDGGAENVHETYLLDKLTVVDGDNDSGRLYRGYPVGEIHEINPDYMRRNKEKLYFHLPLQYDCCSDCLEDFPHRVHYSQQSFQEELSDTYQKFLPNNYRDIEGETGSITNMFRIQNNLYLHTEEALWHLPQNIQERTTGDIVSFLGTGDFFSIPPRRIVDSNGNSGGTSYKWATVKTPYGVFFIADREKKVYQFNGQTLTPISSKGMYSWFKKNMSTQAADYFSSHNDGREYRYINSASEMGCGYSVIYDSRNERVIFTERDFRMYGGEPSIVDFEVSYSNGNIYFFEDYSTIISAQETLGYTLSKIEIDTMYFYNYITNDTNTVVGNLLDEVDKAWFLEGKKEASWTASYSLKDESWTSFHSYLPDFSYFIEDRFFTWVQEGTYFWEHNKKGLYHNFYFTAEAHVLEYVVSSNPLENTIKDDLKLYTRATEENDVEVDKTFNKALIYNSTQSTGQITLVVKDNEAMNYLMNRVTNKVDEFTLDRNEGIWGLNSFRDFAIDTPLFTEGYDSTLSYYSDKTIVTGSIDLNKDWRQLESFRGKYLVVRLILDNFTNTRLTTQYSVLPETKSIR